MSQTHRWRFCLLASLLLHFLVLTARYQPEPPLAEQPRVVPLTFTAAPPPALGQRFALRQMAAVAGDPEGPSPEEFRRQAQALFLAQVTAAVEKRKFQPPDADFSRIIGNVRYAFTIDAQGGFCDIRLLRSSGSGQLDRAAHLAIAKSSGTLRRPPIIGSAPITLALTIKYQYGL